MPQFKVDGKMVFERDLQEGFTQTLEPRVRYLYVPYRDQSEIGNYDSTLLQSDYTGLFRDRTYSGLDRIASANQVTTGLTSRVYDAAAVERFNISVGQIYYFTESRTGDDNINWENNDTWVHWSGPAIPTGALPMNGVCAEGSSTIRVWITLPLVTAPLNTVAMRTA